MLSVSLRRVRGMPCNWKLSPPSRLHHFVYCQHLISTASPTQLDTHFEPRVLIFYVNIMETRTSQMRVHLAHASWSCRVNLNIGRRRQCRVFLRTARRVHTTTTSPCKQASLSPVAYSALGPLGSWLPVTKYNWNLINVWRRKCLARSIMIVIRIWTSLTTIQLLPTSKYDIVEWYKMHNSQDGM